MFQYISVALLEDSSFFFHIYVLLHLMKLKMQYTVHNYMVGR